MTGKALICKLGQHISISGADRIVQVNMFGETIITQKTNEEGTIGLLFDCETQLSHEFCSANNLYRNKELNSNKEIVGYFEDNRRVRPIKLKGVKCSGMWIGIESLSSMIDKEIMSIVTVGQEIDNLEGIPICSKYIPKATREAGKKNKEGKSKEILCPTFKEHMDTDQIMRNISQIKEGDLITVTEKLHGTSGRCGYLQVEKKLPLWKRILGYLADRRWITTYLSYEFVVGSRRVVKRIGELEKEGKSYYDFDIWTAASERFRDKLYKGETIYFEITSYLPSGQPIMGTQSNEKLKKFMDKKEYKAFIEKYGNTTEFSYGCNKDEYKVFVYRITRTNEDGETIDLSWDQVKNRCEILGVEHVPELNKVIIPTGFDHRDLAEAFQFKTDRESTVFPQHIKEGIVVRIDNGGMTPKLFKNKSYIFKVLEGIIKDSNQVDIEESN